MKLHGTPTTTELKKKSTRTTRLVRRQDPAGQLRKTMLTCRYWKLGSQPWGLHRRGWLKGTQSWLWAMAGVAVIGEAPSPTGQSESPLKSTLEMTSQATLSPLWPHPHRQCHCAAKRGALPGWIPKAPPPYNLTGVPRKRNMAQMKEHSKTSERQLSNEEITNLSDGQFKALVVKILTELIGLGSCFFSKNEKTNERYPKWNKAKRQEGTEKCRSEVALWELRVKITSFLFF